MYKMEVRFLGFLEVAVTTKTGHKTMKYILAICATLLSASLEAGTAYDVMGSVVRVELGDSSGSAVAVAKTEDKITLVTNWHVVRDLTKVQVCVFVWNDVKTQIVGWYKTEAEVLVSDKGLDLAVLEMLNLTDMPVACADAEAAHEILDPVLAVGCGYGQDSQIYRGVIIDQDWDAPDGKQAHQNLLQADAEIVPGCSGGGLFKQIDGHWKLVGITVAGWNGSEMTYYIPIARVKALLESLTKK